MLRVLQVSIRRNNNSTSGNLFFPKPGYKKLQKKWGLKGLHVWSWLGQQRVARKKKGLFRFMLSWLLLCQNVPLICACSTLGVLYLCPCLLSRNRTIKNVSCAIISWRLRGVCVCALSLGPRYCLQCRTEVSWAGGCPACALFLINHNATSKLFHQGSQLSKRKTDISSALLCVGTTLPCVCRLLIPFLFICSSCWQCC